MKHNILVKFKKEIDYNSLIPEIKNLFDGLKEIEGINDINIKTNCINKENRYHLLIQIDMNKEVLPMYDESAVHKKWKQDYSEYIESKAIFDFE